MKKVLWMLLFLLQILPSGVSARSIVTNKKESRTSTINITSFPDYFPIAYTAKEGNNDVLGTIFAPAMKQIAMAGNLEFKYVLKKNYDEAVTDVRRGEIEILLGMYYGTIQYSGLEYIFPAVLNNPVYIIMRPENIDKVSKPEDLKNLRGLYIAQEYFSDYMRDNFKNYNIKPIKTALEAYEKLFTGEADYIAGGYYYNYAEICRLGLRDYVSFSKSALWNMPLFIGVSKASRQHAKIGKLLKQFAADEKFQQSINDTLKELIYRVEVESQGVVPPMFVKNEDGTKTPADEISTGIPEEIKE